MNSRIIPFSNCRLITILYSLSVFVVIAFLYHSNMTGGAYDVAAHSSLVDKIDKDFFISSGYTANLNEMAKYPPVAHYIAAFLNYFTDSTLLSMNLVNLMSLFAIWIVIALILLETGPIALMVVSSIIGWTAWHGMVLPIMGLEVIGGDFLYGQFVSTAYFLVLMYALYRSKFSLRSSLIVSLIGFYVGLYIHASFAVIYFAGSCFYFIFNEFIAAKGNGFVRSRILSIFGYGLVGVLFFLTHPYTKFANEMKLHNGHLAFSYFTSGPTDLSFFGAFFIVLMLFLSGIIISFYIFAPKFRKILSPNLTLVAIFLLGATCIAALQFLLFELGEASPYVVKKNFFALFTFSLIIIAILAEKAFIYFIPRFYDLVPLNKRVMVVVFTPALFILISVIYWSSSQSSIAVIMKAQAVAKDYHARSVGDPSYRNTVAQFQGISMPSNWMITLSELQVEKHSIQWKVAGPLSKAVVLEDMHALPDTAFVLSEAREDGIPDNGLLTGPYRVYSAKAYNTPMLAPSGKAIIFNDKNPYAAHYLSEGFSWPEPWGVWSDEEQAEIKFSLTKPPIQPVSIVLNSTAWIAKGHESFIASVFFKGKQVATREYSDNKVIAWQFYLSPQDIGIDREIVIKLKFSNSVSPLLVGQSLDPRKLGVGLLSLHILY